MYIASSADCKKSIKMVKQKVANICDIISHLETFIEIILNSRRIKMTKYRNAFHELRKINCSITTLHWATLVQISLKFELFNILTGFKTTFSRFISTFWELEIAINVANASSYEKCKLLLKPFYSKYKSMRILFFINL